MGGAIPAEEVTVVFTRITWEHGAQNPDGSLEPPVSSCWDVTAASTC